MADAYEKRAKARSLQSERRLMGETLEAFHWREHARPPTLAEIFAENHRNRERCPATSDLFGEGPTRKKHKMKPRTVDAVCAECGVQFQPFKLGQLSCSRKCSQRRRNRRQALSPDSKLKRRRKYLRQRARELGAAIEMIPVRACAECFEMFQPKSDLHICCSRPCNKRRARRRHKEKYLLARGRKSVPRFCVNPKCRVPLSVDQPLNTLYCTERCRLLEKRHLREMELAKRECERCGRPIDSRRLRTRYCSFRCRRASGPVPTRAQRDLENAKKRQAFVKAKGLDALLKLLEKANVDTATKTAIGRLRTIVDGESTSPGEMLGGTAQTSADGYRR